MSSELLDVVLIGGGIMSAHVGTLLKSLEPRLKIEVYEAAPEWASESSDAWHNAGTGHAGLCELNYTPPPLVPGAAFDVSKAVDIFARFERSRQFWSYAVAQNWMPDPTRFIRRVPHLTFVRGEEATALLRARQSALTAHPLFQSMEFTADRDRISSWTPLLTEGRGLEPLAATRVAAGTDVNFGELSRGLLSWLNQQEGSRVFTGHRVTQLKQADGTWTLTVRHQDSKETRQVCARFVFVGAGGGTLPLLQSARLPLTKGLAAFPIAGQWLLCKNPSVVARHFAKAYGPPPPNSGALGGPHLDVRHIGDERVLLFGPFATGTTKFLHRTGRVTDLAASVRTDNLSTLLRAGLGNQVLVRFLTREALQSQSDRLRTLRTFYPMARADDWELIDAGIRVQAIKKSDRGRLYFGTEVITTDDHSLAALLGASPGASVAAHIALEVIQRCFPRLLQSSYGYAQMKRMIPSLDLDLSDPHQARSYLERSTEIDQTLRLEGTETTESRRSIVG